MGEVVASDDNGRSGDDSERIKVVSPCALDGRLVAPFLRVEKLRDDAVGEGYSSYSSGSSCSSLYGTDDECAFSGEISSDQDGSAQAIKEKKTGTGEATGELIIPSEELKQRIMEQVEFYFSNDNIIHDAFMLKHVRRNKEGYVSLKLVSSFRKVKSLTKDYRVVAYCLRCSEKLEVNEEGTKVRRKDPLPDYDETTPSRTIVAANLSSENPTVEEVAELFSKFGEITLIRILRPGKTIPQDVKKYLGKHPELSNTVCALIEYERHESAKRSYEDMNESGEDRQKGIKVILLAQPRKKPVKDEKKTGKEVQKSNNKKLQKENTEKGFSDHQSQPKEDLKKPLQLDDEGATSPVIGKSTLTPHQDPHRLSPCQSPRTTPRSSPKSSPRSSPRGSPSSHRRRNHHGPSPLAATDSPRSSSPENQSKTNATGQRIDECESPSLSPWVKRRLRAQEENTLAGNSPGTSPRLARRAPEITGLDGVKYIDIFGVLRQPRGPDGSQGFQLHRTKN